MAERHAEMLPRRPSHTSTAGSRSGRNRSHCNVPEGPGLHTPPAVSTNATEGASGAAACSDEENCALGEEDVVAGKTRREMLGADSVSSPPCPEPPDVRWSTAKNRAKDVPSATTEAGFHLADLVEDSAQNVCVRRGPPLSRHGEMGRDRVGPCEEGGGQRQARARGSVMADALEVLSMRSVALCRSADSCASRAGDWGQKH